MADGLGQIQILNASPLAIASATRRAASFTITYLTDVLADQKPSTHTRRISSAAYPPFPGPRLLPATAPFTRGV